MSQDTRALLVQLIKAIAVVAIGGAVITAATVSFSPDNRPYYSVIANKRVTNITADKDTHNEHIGGVDIK